MKNMQSGNAAVAGLIWLIMVILIVVGWFKNLSMLIDLEVLTMTAENIIRLAGVVVVPLGSIMGWFF